MALTGGLVDHVLWTCESLPLAIKSTGHMC